MRLTDRARQEVVRRFSAVVLGQNREALGLFNSFGDVRREYDAGMVDLVIELPPKRGIGARLARVLREVAAGNLLVAQARVAGDAKIGEVDAETTESSGA
jgi:hypothetical protein